MKAQLLDTKQAAWELGVSPATLERWRSRPPQFPVPKHVKVGGRVKYRLSELEAYVEQGVQQ